MSQQNFKKNKLEGHSKPKSILHRSGDIHYHQTKDLGISDNAQITPKLLYLLPTPPCAGSQLR